MTLDAATAANLDATLGDPEESDCRIGLASATDTGRRRQRNEDSVVALRREGSDDVLVLVADGMGGHLGGAEASQLAATLLSERFVEGRLQTKEDLSSSILECDRVIKDAHLGGGTTIVASVIAHDSLLVAHVGDSRAYMLRGGCLLQLTRDHSWVQEQVDAGAIPEEEASSHPRRNVLVKAVGTGRREEPDLRHVRFLDGDVLLECSDGLHGVVDGGTIAAVLDTVDGSEESLCHAGRRLVELALEAGGPDNVTVALAARLTCDPKSGRYK